MEKISVQEKVENFRKFYSMENDSGPLVGFFLDSYYPLIRFRTKSYLKGGFYNFDDLHVERFLDQYERLYQLYESYGGDFIWSASAFWGVPWLEAIIGCRVFADYNTGSSRSYPPEKSIESANDIPDFDLENPWVKKTIEFLKLLSGHSNKRYPLATTLMRGISDLLAAIYEGGGFIYKLMDDAKVQKEIIKKLAGIITKFAKIQLDNIPDFFGGVGSFYYSMWMPGRGVWLQEDASAMLSPSLFHEFILPNLNEIINQFDSSIMHLHPSSYIPVDYLIETNLTAIELHIDYGGPRASELFSVYEKILSKKPLIIWGDFQKDDIDFILKKLDKRKLAIMPVVDTRDKAEEIWRLFKR